MFVLFRAIQKKEYKLNKIYYSLITIYDPPPPTINSRLRPWHAHTTQRTSPSPDFGPFRFPNSNDKSQCDCECALRIPIASRALNPFGVLRASTKPTTSSQSNMPSNTAAAVSGGAGGGGSSSSSGALHDIQEYIDKNELSKHKTTSGIEPHPFTLSSLARIRRDRLPAGAERRPEGALRCAVQSARARRQAAAAGDGRAPAQRAPWAGAQGAPGGAGASRRRPVPGACSRRAPDRAYRVASGARARAWALRRRWCGSVGGGAAQQGGDGE